MTLFRKGRYKSKHEQTIGMLRTTYTLTREFCVLQETIYCYEEHYITCVITNLHVDARLLVKAERLCMRSNWLLIK